MSASAPPGPRLSTIAMAVLAVLAQGCCLGVDEEERTEAEFEGVVDGELLAEIRATESTDDDRCRAACMAAGEDFGRMPDEVETCSASGDVLADDPWAPENTAVTVMCTGVIVMGQFCTGRRPLGHHEADIAVVDVGTWLAVHAHLERASITAFAELADWLTRQGAPAEIVARCRHAGDDEVVHARRLEMLARRCGAAIPEALADAPAQDPVAVAVQNAVEGCVHEAFAAIVAAHQAEHAHTDELRAVFGRIASDELRHGQLAWDLQRWLLAGLAPDARAHVLAAQRLALADLPDRIADAAARTPPSLGWPCPQDAARMARRFAALVQSAMSTSSSANSHA